MTFAVGSSVHAGAVADWPRVMEENVAVGWDTALIWIVSLPNDVIAETHNNGNEPARLHLELPVPDREEEGVDDARVRRDGHEGGRVCREDIVQRQPSTNSKLRLRLLVHWVPEGVVLRERGLKVEPG